jgi:phosphoribosyl-ATP pyrophosphohydrolase/phosphoribosyl-AMP cyclohydrolase
MIIPSIDIMDGRAVQLRQGRDFALDGGDPMQRLEQFSLVGEVAVIDLDAALGKGSNKALIKKMAKHASIRVGGGIRSQDSAREWLDAGAAKVIIGTRASPEFFQDLPGERMIAAVDAFRGEIVVDGWRNRTGTNLLDQIALLAPFVGGFLLTQVEHEGGMAGFDMDLVRQAREIAAGVPITAAGGITSTDEIGELDALGLDAQIGMALYSGKLSLGASVAACLRKPIDERLWPTIVCDELGNVLGLVWSTRESVAQAIDSRRGIYFSRSRDQLWIKGETSGATQQLKAVSLDCDRDALRVTVQQNRGFCHLPQRSCFGNDFDLGALERLLRQRKSESDSGSGTRKLFDNPELLTAKLIEEANELSQADSPEAAIHEAADLLYFTMVALINKGGSMEQLVQELRQRNLRIQRRPMKAKETAG